MRKSPSSVTAMSLTYLTDLASCGFVSGENYSNMSTLFE